MKVGCHVSIRNGYLAAALQAVKLKAKSYQYFPKNPRSLSVKAFDQQDAERCAIFCREQNILSVAHAPYPTNLAAEANEMKRAVRDSVLNDLEIAEACHSLGLVIHFGKGKDTDPLEGYKRIVEMLNEVVMNWQGNALLLIENNAGQGVKMGTTLEEMVQIRNLTDYRKKIGFCFDTCHAYASGLWNGNDWKTVMETGGQLGYFKHLKAVHLNDSLYPCKSHRDRHANIGKGCIGEKHLKELIQSTPVRDLPMILETPHTDHYSSQEEISYVKKLFCS